MNQASSRNDDMEQRPWWAFGCGPNLTPTDLRNSRLLSLLMLSWAAVSLGCLFAVTHWEETLGVWRLPLAAIPSVVLLGVVMSFVKFIREADELTRKIQLESLAVGFGASLWFMFTWAGLEKVGLPELDVFDGILVMALSYVINVMRLHRRFS